MRRERGAAGSICHIVYRTYYCKSCPRRFIAHRNINRPARNLRRDGITWPPACPDGKNQYVYLHFNHSSSTALRISVARTNHESRVRDIWGHYSIRSSGTLYDSPLCIFMINTYRRQIYCSPEMEKPSMSVMPRTVRKSHI